MGLEPADGPVEEFRGFERRDIEGEKRIPQGRPFAKSNFERKNLPPGNFPPRRKESKSFKSKPAFAAAEKPKQAFRPFQSQDFQAALEPSFPSNGKKAFGSNQPKKSFVKPFAKKFSAGAKAKRRPVFA